MCEWRVLLKLNLAFATLRHVLHDLFPCRSVYVFLASNRCPRIHTTLSAFVGPYPMPRITFSALVTGSMCDGFTHEGLRHKWSISRFGGISPTSNLYATRCAGDISPFEPPTRKRPYPAGTLYAFHNQHPGVTLTLLQNLCSKVLTRAPLECGALPWAPLPASPPLPATRHTSR